MAKIRVLIVDDHAIVRAGLRMLINPQPDMEVVGEAADGHEALCQAREAKPDVLTLDLTMPGGGGLKILERLRQACPQTRVLVLTMHEEPSYLRAVLAAGGSGYVAKSAVDGELVAAIRSVAQGRTFVTINLSDSETQQVLGDRARRFRHASSVLKTAIRTLYHIGISVNQHGSSPFLGPQKIGSSWPGRCPGHP